MKRILTAIAFLLLLHSPSRIAAAGLKSGDANNPYDSVTATSGRHLRVETQGKVEFRTGANLTEAGVFWPDQRFEVFASFHTYTGAIAIKPQNTGIEGGELQLYAANPSASTWHIDHYTDQLRFFKGTSPAAAVFAANGNVGIGTSTPDYRLDVNGGIRAKEFFVQTGWSDFVFEDDYALPTLAEVEAHIEARGHLPGVPSAAEIQANGLEMGQAQTLMMQKIEELTLYVLQLSKENQALRSEMESLRTRVEAR